MKLNTSRFVTRHNVTSLVLMLTIFSMSSSGSKSSSSSRHSLCVLVFDGMFSGSDTVGTVAASSLPETGEKINPSPRLCHCVKPCAAS
jgi:hypothetical protein